MFCASHMKANYRFEELYWSLNFGVSWASGLVHRTQVLVLSENQNVGSIPGSGTCVLQQDT